MVLQVRIKTLEFFPTRDFRQVWQLPNCKIIMFVDVWRDVKPNYEIQSLYCFKYSWLYP